jgi:hypothetical protein
MLTGEATSGSVLTMGASRFTPKPDAPPLAAPVYITAVRSSGRDVPIAEWGETAVRRIPLRPYENSVEVDFVGIELGACRSLDYEYKLDGAQRDWQALGRERSIRFAGLAPGVYRLLPRHQQRRRGDGRRNGNSASAWKRGARSSSSSRSA